MLYLLVRRVSWAVALMSSGPRVKVEEAGINETGGKSLSWRIFYNTVYTGSYSSHASEGRPRTKKPGPIYTRRYNTSVLRCYFLRMVSVRKVQTHWCHVDMSCVFSEPTATIYHKTDPSKVTRHQSGFAFPKTYCHSCL